MADIVTLTVNPSIDVWTSIGQLLPFHKLRCTAERRDPGGGGINVARVMHRLGADVTAMYAQGGTLGRLLRRLLDQEGIPGLPVPITEETREDFTILEEMSGRQYRFILPGPTLSEQEWRAFLEHLRQMRSMISDRVSWLPVEAFRLAFRSTSMAG